MKSILKSLGPLPFEAMAIASISVFLNILTSLALDSTASNKIIDNYNVIGLLISAFLLFLLSFYFSKKLNDIFLLTQSERDTQINHIKRRTLSFIILSLSFISFIYFLFALFNFTHKIEEKRIKQISIAYQEISLYQHIFIAQEKGYFIDEGLKVNLRSFASANHMMEAFLSNQIDVLGLTNTQVALTVEGKHSGQLKFINFLVWKEDAFPDYIVSRKDALIKTPRDLEGKTVGLHPGSAVRAFSQAVFEHYKLDVSKIRTIELRPEIMQSTMIAGNVAAVYCMDPVATTLFLTGLTDTLIANPMKYIFPAPTPISGTAISKKLAQDNPEVAQKLIRAIDRAIDYTRQPGVEEEIAGYIAKYTPIRKEQTLLMNASIYWKSNEMEPERIQALANKFFELGIVEREINIETMLFQTEILPQ